MQHPTPENIPSSTEEFIKRYELHRLHYDLFDRLLFVVATALGLLAAFAWDDVFHEFFSSLFVFLGEPMTKFAYAITLTILASVTALLFKKISNKRHSKGTHS